MKNLILLTIVLSTLFSCAQTKINPNSKKSVHWVNNDDIVSNQKIHEATFWTRQYKAKEVFPNNKEAQEKLEEANQFRRYEAYSIWTLLATSIYYSNNNQDNSDIESNNSNIIFLAGIIPAIYFLTKGHEKATEAVNHYNKEKGYSLYPMIQRIDQNSKASLVFSTTF
tara:strand:+ start:106 stop:609 length:504 start_codon:yes stop_codon:yes gene_type:complete